MSIADLDALRQRARIESFSGEETGWGGEVDVDVE